MSTILKTLRKLEQDKKRVERKVDLKRLVVHDDSRKHRIENLHGNGKWWMGLLFIAVGTLLGAGVVALTQNPDALMTASVDTTVAKRPAAVVVKPTPPSPDKIQSRSPANESLHGVALASIPDFEPIPDVIEESDVVEEMVPAIEPRMIETPVPDPQPMEPVPEAGQHLVEDAGSEIVSALSEIPRQKRAQFTPPVPEEREVILREVPGLKIKGIIFFGDKNPANYIFFSIDGGPIQKLKAGDSVYGATLMDIQPGVATFNWQEQTIQQKVGSG